MANSCASTIGSRHAAPTGLEFRLPIPSTNMALLRELNHGLAPKENSRAAGVANAGVIREEAKTITS